MYCTAMIVRGLSASNSIKTILQRSCKSCASCVIRFTCIGK